MSFTSIRYVNVSHFELDIMILKKDLRKGTLQYTIEKKVQLEVSNLLVSAHHIILRSILNIKSLIFVRD